MAGVGALSVAGLMLLRAQRVLHRVKVEAAADEREERTRNVCADARAIIDLTSPIDGSHGPSTAMLTELGQRLRHLDGRLGRFLADAGAGRIEEAVEDVRRVGVSLAAALDVERGLRVAVEAAPEHERARSAKRIAGRAAELDLAVTELLFVVETV